MTAPISAYHTKALKDKTTPQNYLMCKFLSEYTSIGTHFYLDKIVKYKDGSIFYFGGACLVGSENSKYHARKRVGKLFDGIELYTDGGLNTYGHGDIIAILSSDAPDKDANVENYPPRINNTTLFTYFSSAYWLNSTSLKIEIKDDNNPGLYWEVQDFGSLSSNSSSSPRSSIVSRLTKSGLHKFRVTITNSEGTKVFDDVEVDIRMAIFNFTYNSLFASDAVSGTPVTRYGTTRDLLDAENNADQATQLFTNEVDNIHTSNGYYVADDMWYQYGYDTLGDRYAILAKGQAQTGGYPSGDPGNIVQDPVIPDVNGFSQFDWETAVTQVLSGNYITTPLYLGHNFETGITSVYTNSSYTQIAQAGYYVQGTWQLQNLDRYIQVGDNGVLLYDEPVKP